MSRQLDIKAEERTSRRRAALERALDYELAGSIEAAGATFLGFSLKYDDFECWIILKAVHGKTHKVAFVNGETIARAILRCVTMAQHDRLKWKVDAFAKDNS